MNNPLFDIWLKEKAKNRFYSYARGAAVKTYSWAVPSKDALEWIKERCPRIIEIGAGTGYWASLLKVDIVATEPTANDGEILNNHWHEEGIETYHPLLRSDHNCVVNYPDRTLFLCWPPYSTSMAADTLKLYQGNQLLYIGQGSGGCNGDDTFWKILDEQWEEKNSFDIPQWPGLHDNITLYVRKI